MAETAALQTPGAPAGRGGTPLPTSPLKGGRSEDSGAALGMARACPAMAMSASRRKISRCDHPARGRLGVAAFRRPAYVRGGGPERGIRSCRTIRKAID